MTLRIALPAIADIESFVTDELDRLEIAGDTYAGLEEHDCINPGGHLFLASGTEEHCLHCRWITWRR
jgi:hypothetical protein